MRRARRERESGFALLLVFLMAAIIAISLYMEVPRVAFQSQRQKEQMLMERGEQYKRAIGLFLRTNKNTRWPATIEELESYNNRRFLRHRYIDPMTGKDEWRLIHIVNGVLTDSILNKKKDQEQDHLAKNGSVMELAALSGPDATGQAGVNALNRRRVSEGGVAPLGPDGQPIVAAGPTGQSGFPGNAPPPFPGATGPTSATGIAGVSGFTGITSATGIAPPQPGGPPVGIAGLLGIPTAPTGPTGSSASSSAGGGLSGGFAAVGGGIPSLLGGAGGYPGAVAGSGAAGGIITTPAPQPTGPPGGVTISPQAQAAAQNLIQGLLTSPRPGGMQGLPQAGGGAIMGSGIAGVASKAEGDSIMVYADRSDYSEWEFIYDPVKFAPPTNPNTGNPSATPAQQLGAALTGPNVMNQNGTPAASLPGGVGMSVAGPMGPAGAMGASGATGATGSTPMGGSSGFGQAPGGGQAVRPGKAW
jgi:type II secretory pathway pseudopilin PulG